MTTPAPVETPIQAAARFRRDLQRSRQGAADRLARAYADAARATRADRDRLLGRIQKLRDEGLSPTPAQVRAFTQYEQYLGSVGRELTNLAPFVADVTDELVVEALRLGAIEGALLAEAAGAPGLGALNVRASVQITAVTDRGAVEELIRARAGAASAQAAEVLRTAVIRGQSPAKTARELQRVTGGAFTNALTVAKTEQFRALREATRQSYIDNPAIRSYVWSARLSGRTCAFCWAKHGTIHSVREPMGTHPNCQCVMVPLVDGVEYGERGAEKFLTLPDGQQEQILGSKAAKRAFDDGAVTLGDFVSEYRHPVWGPSGRAASLTEVLGPEAAKYLRARP